MICPDGGERDGEVSRNCTDRYGGAWILAFRYILGGRGRGQKFNFKLKPIWLSSLGIVWRITDKSEKPHLNFIKGDGSCFTVFISFRNAMRFTTLHSLVAVLFFRAEFRTFRRNLIRPTRRALSKKINWKCPGTKHTLKLFWYRMWKVQI